ncbi:MAG: Gfo/Idh/MocA family oxidoreductase [Spirochaetota bacterium]
MKHDNLPFICFFGCGYIAKRHAKIIRKMYPDIRLGFSSLYEKDAKEYAAQFNGVSFQSYEEAAQSDCDIAFITTPHAYHKDLAILAANNKKHIIVEKPATRNLKEFDAIVKAVIKNNVRFTVAENYYFKPFLKTIHKHIAIGSIGKPLYIRLTKHNHDTIAGWRTDAALMGGGALLEGGCHWVNELVSLAGATPVAVQAIKADIVYQTNIPFEDTIHIAVKFDNGTFGTLFHSWFVPNTFKGMALSKIYGTEGNITFESNGLFTIVKGNRFAMSISFRDFLGFGAMHRSFIENYRTQKPWEPDYRRIRKELALIEAAYRSLKTNRFEEI